MPSLLELQCGMRRALCDGGVPPWVAGDDAAERLAVYRGTIRGTLVKALRLSFPTIERLVGSEFFEGAAAIFAQAHAADSADLDAYGAGFADFLQDLPQCAHLEYVPDVARLDWAVARALHAPDARALPQDELAEHLGRADELCLVVHPSVTLLRSAFTIHEIWRAVLARDDALLTAVDLTAGPIHLIVQRTGQEVEVVELDPAEWRFAHALFGGMPLGGALELEPVDGAACLARHLAAGRIVGITSDQEKEKK